MLVSILLLGVIGSVPATSWPLRLTFWLSQGDLRQLADGLEKGEELSFPRRAGCFRVEFGERTRDRTCLWLDTDPGGPRGFVASPPGEPPWHNLWSSISLGGDWHLIKED